MAKKNRNAAEKAYLNTVAEMGCIACEQIGYEGTPAEIHHIREGQGIGQRASDFDAIPLCPHHHRQGPNAYHVSKLNFEADFGTELHLLKIIQGRMNYV